MARQASKFSIMALAATSFIALSVASTSAHAAQATFGPAPVGLAFSEDTATVETSQFTIGPAPATTSYSGAGGGPALGGSPTTPNYSSTSTGTAVWGGTATNTSTSVATPGYFPTSTTTTASNGGLFATTPKAGTTLTKAATYEDVIKEKGGSGYTLQNAGSYQTDPVTGMYGKVYSSYYQDGSAVQWMQVKNTDGSTKTIPLAEMNKDGARLTTFAATSELAQAANVANGWVQSATGIAGQLSNIMNNPDAIAQQMKNHMGSQLATAAASELKEALAAKGVSLETLNKLGPDHLLSYAHQSQLNLVGLTGMDYNQLSGVLNGNTDVLKSMGASQLNGLMGTLGLSQLGISGNTLQSVLKGGGIDNVMGVGPQQIGNLLGFDPSLLSGVHYSELSNILKGDLSGLASLGGPKLASLLGVDPSVLNGLNTSQLSGLLSGDLGSLAGLGSDQLGQILGMNSDFLGSLDTSQLAGLLGGDFGSLGFDSSQVADMLGLDMDQLAGMSGEEIAGMLGMDGDQLADMFGVADIGDLTGDMFADGMGDVFSSGGFGDSLGGLTGGGGMGGLVGGLTGGGGGGISNVIGGSGGGILAGIGGGGGGLFGGGGSGGSTARGAPLVPHGGG